ncbi:hypothetical protein IPV09_13120 [Tessaracoccus sp. SD287]|uniref:DUF6049 family protein n=1 Tax=Tessaracoccus sp. SD287 TaxID=2782008 RepID=UPI001A971520|nr:hypothetical protein [Tessaracoccus sp. SD287]
MTRTVVTRALMLALACLLALVGALSSPATAPADEGKVSIRLQSVTPDALTADGTVTITGQVTNTSAVAMTQVQVSFWRSTDPVTSDADVDLLLRSAWDAPIGARGTADQNLFNITTDQEPALQPGVTRSFTVTATVAQLGFTNPGPGTAFLAGVHVRGIPVGDVNQTLGRARLFLPWQPATAARVAPVVLLTSAPSLALDGTLTDDHVAGELSGRLATLLRAAELPGATVLVDPALIDELRTMSDGYRVAGAMVPADDPRAVSARDWLARFEALTGKIHRTPYGNPDLAAAAADKRVEVIQRAQKALPPDHELASLPLAVWPERAGLDATARAFVAPLKPSLWVQPAGIDGRFSLPDGSSLVTYEPAITQGGPGPDPRDSLPQRRGRLLSELVLAPHPTVLAVRTAEDAATALSLPSWVRTVALDEVATAPGGPPQSLPPTTTPLSQVWGSINQNHRRITGWYDLIGVANDGALPAAQIASRAANPRLGSAAVSWLDRSTASIPANLSAAGVSLQMAETFVLGDSTGTLPITITNSSDHAVRVKVRMTSDNAQRITIPDTDLVTVPARSSVSVQFTPRANSNGVVEFTAQALTQGNLAVGAEQRFSVNATDFGRVGWLIIIASGVVVLGGTAMRIKQVQRERVEQSPPVAAASTSSATPRHDTSSRPHP